MMAGGNAQPAQNMQASWVAYAAILIVGFLSLLSLYMGFINYADSPDVALIFLFLGAAGKEEPLTVKKVEVFTTLECPKCQQKRVRDFKRGDFVFKDDEPCTRCDGMMMITKISRKKEDEKKKSDDLSGL